MRVRGEIPGVGEIDIEGNFATEDTLKKLIEAVEKNAEQDKINTDDVNDNLDDLEDNLDDANEELSLFGKGIEKAKNLQEKHGKAIRNGIEDTKDFFKNISRASNAGEAVGETISSLGKAAGNTISALGVLAPGGPIAKLGLVAAGQAVTGISALGGAALGTLDEYRGINKQIQDAGVQIRGGFDAFADAAAAAEIPIHEFGEAIISGRDTLRLLSSGAPGGVRAVSNAFKSMSDETESSLRSLGFTTEEIVQGMASYAAGAERAGRDLTPDQLAAESTEYLKNLRELSRLTGEDVKSLQARIEADRANLFIENEISKVSGKNQEDVRAFAAALSQMGFGAIRDFALSGRMLTEESGFLVSQFPQFSNVIRSVTEQVKSGALTQEQGVEEIQRRFREAGPALSAELRRAEQTFGDIAATGKFRFGDTLGEFALGVRKVQGGFESLADTDASKITEGSVQDAIGAVETAGKRIQSAIQDVTLRAVSVFSEELETLAETTGRYASVIADNTDFLLGESVQKDVRGNISSVDEFNTAVSKLQAGTITSDERQELIELVRQRQREELYQNTGLYESTDIVDGMNDVLTRMGYGLTAMLRNGFEDLFFNLGNMTMSDDEILKELRRLNTTVGAAPQQADGGIVESPTTGGITITHGTEAVVPLPDGRSIPVDLTFSVTPEEKSEPVDLTSSVQPFLSDIKSFLKQDRENINELHNLNSIPEDLKSTIQSFVSDMTSLSRQDKENIQELRNLNSIPVDLKSSIQSFVSDMTSLSRQDKENIQELRSLNSIPVDLKSTIQSFVSDMTSLSSQDKENIQELRSLNSMISELNSKIDQVGAAATREVELASSQNQKTDNLISVTRNMLNQMVLTAERMEKMTKSMEENNYIASKSRFSKA